MKKKCLQQKGHFSHPGQKGWCLSTTRGLSVHVPVCKYPTALFSLFPSLTELDVHSKACLCFVQNSQSHFRLMMNILCHLPLRSELYIWIICSGERSTERRKGRILNAAIRLALPHSAAVYQLPVAIASLPLGLSLLLVSAKHSLVTLFVLFCRMEVPLISVYHS